VAAITFPHASLKRLRLYRTLSHRPILTLWTGEAFSAIGDEIYKVALVWLTVKMVGASAGYLTAGQAASVLIVGLLGGLWADRWDPRKTMIRVDWIRGLLVLIPVVWSQFYPLNMGILVFVALSVAGLGAFFEPALQAVIPRLARDRELMQATNGLMGTTSRLARTVGPGLVGLLTGLIPQIHFFTLDAASFAVSAFAVKSLHRELPEQSFVHAKTNLIESVLSGFRLMKNDREIQFIIVGKAIISGAWSMILPLGIALMIQQDHPGDVQAYGFLLASYGIGNLMSALVLANLDIRLPIRTMGRGFLLIGAGFAAMALFKSLPLMMLCAAISAVGGPMNDLAHLDIFQHKFKPEKLVQVVRFRMTMECAGILICLLIAPELYHLFPARVVMEIASLVILLVGLVGIFLIGENSNKKLSTISEA
jgi:hypothetical protein